MKKEKEKKQTFTYYGTPSVREKAMGKAEKEGLTFGELVDTLLGMYNKKRGRLLEQPKKKTVLVFGNEELELHPIK